MNNPEVKLIRETDHVIKRGWGGLKGASYVKSLGEVTYGPLCSEER